MAARFPDNGNDWLDQFCLVYKLSEKTKEILLENDLTNEDDLSEVTDKELGDIDISLGQRKAILRGIRECKDGIPDLTNQLAKITIDKISNLNRSTTPAAGKILELSFVTRDTFPKKMKAYFVKMFRKNKKARDELNINERIGNLEVIRCMLEETWRNEEYKIRHCVTGEVAQTTASKTVFMVGATGSGKSTLIDGMVNYIFGAKFKENYRMKLVDLTPEEKRNAERGEAVSQTDWITVYTIPNSAETTTKYVLNIVDTPGFGDTRGIERDGQLVQQVKYFFENTEEHGVDMVNAICFVAQAPQPRLTPTQKYIFQAILSMFGKNVIDNIFIMATFSDGNTPPLIASLEAAEVPYNMYLQFNNSALFSPSKVDKRVEDKKHAEKQMKMTQMFWDIGYESFEKFFIQLEKTSAQSLRLSAQVLNEREKLSCSIEYMQELIKLGCQKLIRLVEEQAIIKQHLSQVRENKNFEYEVREEQLIKEKVPDGRFTTNCSYCHVTCHKVCKIKNDEKKYKCSAMDKETKTCINCPNKCKWDLHFNQGYVFNLHVKKVKKTYFDMKNRYELAKEIVDDKMQILQRIENECKKTEKQLRLQVRVARDCLSQLRKIALKPDPLTDIQYIELLIQDERREAKFGWEQRIDILEKLKQKADILSVVERPNIHKTLLETSLHEKLSVSNV